MGFERISGRNALTAKSLPHSAKAMPHSGQSVGTIRIIASEEIVQGKVCAYDNQKAKIFSDANDIGKVIGIAETSAQKDELITIRYQGIYLKDDLEAGSYYVANDDADVVKHEETSLLNNYFVVIGVALTDNLLLIDTSNQFTIKQA